MVKENRLILRLSTSLLILFVLFSVIACTIDNVINEFSNGFSSPAPLPAWTTKWLKQPACQPPCWEGITPGVSTITDTLRMVENMPGIVNLKGPLSDPTSNRKSVEWDFVDAQNGGGLARSDTNGNLLQSIVFSAGNSLTVADVVSTYGPPSNLVFQDCWGTGCTVDLVYLTSGMKLQLGLGTVYSNGPAFSVNVTPDSKVSTFWFFPPGLEGYNSIAQSPIDTPDGLMNWKGYSTYTNDLSIH